MSDASHELTEVFLSVGQVATLTRRHKRVVIGWIMSCQLPATRDEGTGKYRIALCDLLAFMAKFPPTDSERHKPSDDVLTEQDILASLDTAISYYIDRMTQQTVNSLEYERYRAATKSASDALKALNGEQDDLLRAMLAQTQEYLATVHIPQNEPASS
jgi:hypothetical protein